MAMVNFVWRCKAFFDTVEAKEVWMLLMVIAAYGHRLTHVTSP